LAVAPWDRFPERPTFFAAEESGEPAPRPRGLAGLGTAIDGFLKSPQLFLPTRQFQQASLLADAERSVHDMLGNEASLPSRSGVYPRVGE
jgi:hypothetical protein